jgi:diguanylate cyclase (GGDEF)-like protein/PAS domain S-box-containing protein
MNALNSAASAASVHVNELIGATAELTVLVGHDLRIVYASPTAASMLGHDPVQIVGHPVGSIVHPSHAGPLEKALHQVLAGSVLGEAELRFPHQSGAGSLPLKVGFNLLSTEGRTEGVMITARHMPTRQALEAALAFDDDQVKELSSKSPLVMFLLDDRGRCTWINQTWVVLTGQSADEAKGLGWLKMADERDRDAIKTVAANAHKRKSGWRQQFRVHGPTGARWIDGASTPRFSTTGAVAGYLVVLADITDEVRSRGEVNRRTTIVESTAQYVVMDDRNQRIVHGTEPAAPLAGTPPLPASTDAPMRSSLGALASPAQSQYLNEIRPAVIADGVWTPNTGPSAPTAQPPSAVDQSVPSDQAGSAGQPVAWNFDTPSTSPEVELDVAPPARQLDATAGLAWSGTPAHVSSNEELNEQSGSTGPEGSVGDSVYVGLVGPSGQVETIAAVSETVLEPTEFEFISDQLPATDSITGLANRALFQERIRLAMNRMQTDGVSVAVMLANLHGYTDLRRQVGPKTGDDQLFVVAKRLEGTIRQADTAARIGDEDFAVLGVGWFFPGDVENAAKRFIVKIQEPLPSIGGQVQLAASMGIAMAQRDEPINMILRRAQQARKLAYEMGAGRVYVDHGPDQPPTKA